MDDPHTAAFRIWLARRMAERQMSGRMLAHLTGVDHSTISRILSGRTPQYATAAALIAVIKECPLHEQEDRVVTEEQRIETYLALRRGARGLDPDVISEWSIAADPPDNIVPLRISDIDALIERSKALQEALANTLPLVPYTSNPRDRWCNFCGWYAPEHAETCEWVAARARLIGTRDAPAPLPGEAPGGYTMCEATRMPGRVGLGQHPGCPKMAHTFHPA